MAKFRAPLATMAAIALLAGCPAPNPAKPDAGAGATGPKASPRPSTGLASQAPAAAQGVTIAGLAVAPAGIVAAGAGNVIVNNGGSIVAAGGGNIVAAGAGNVISPNGGQAPSKLAAGGRALLALSEAPLAGAEVFLAGPDGQPLPDVAPVATDAQGRFRLVGAPTAGTFTVQVRVKNKAGVATTLQTLVKTTTGGATANVSLGTHCVATAVLDGQGGDLGDFNPVKFQSAVTTTDQELTPEAWPDPADRQAILATMSRLEAKIDLLQATMNEIRAELKRLTDRLEASPSPAPAASTSPAGVAPSAAASAAPGGTVADLALRARIAGAGDENMRIVLVAGDSDTGSIVDDDDADVNDGFQLHLAEATFPAVYRVYAQKDASGLEPSTVRGNAANLLGVLTVSGLGDSTSTFVPRTGAALTIDKVRMKPFFEPVTGIRPYSGVLKYQPDDASRPAPAGPVTLQVKAEAGDNWSAKSTYEQTLAKNVEEAVVIDPGVTEIPARFKVEGTFQDVSGATRKEMVGYVRIHRDHLTEEIRVRFDRADGVDLDLDQP